MATAQSNPQVLQFPALPTGRLWKRVTVKRALAGHTLYRLGVLLTLFWVAVALLAPWIAPYSPTQGDAALAKGSPSLAHLFGLDKYGRDILTRVVYGMAQSAGCHCAFVDSERDPARGTNYSTWAVVTTNAAFRASPEIRRALAPFDLRQHPPVEWTDNYGSLWQVLKN